MHQNTIYMFELPNDTSLLFCLVNILPTSPVITGRFRKASDSSPVSKKHVVIVRQPLSPASTQTEIWNAEINMTSGMYTAKGRRTMFRDFRLCQQDEGWICVWLLL